jgi:hypothetical protein
LAARPSRDLVTFGNQEKTRIWWHRHGPQFDLYVSELVLYEIEGGDPEAAKSRLALVEQIPSLDVTLECSRLAQQILPASGLPEIAGRDVLHVAVAAVNEIEFLLTWNCRHIANAVLMPKLSAAIRQLGYSSPMICTPPQLRRTGRFAHEK